MEARERKWEWPISWNYLSMHLETLQFEPVAPPPPETNPPRHYSANLLSYEMCILLRHEHHENCIMSSLSVSQNILCLVIMIVIIIIYSSVAPHGA